MHGERSPEKDLRSYKMAYKKFRERFKFLFPEDIVRDLNIECMNDDKIVYMNFGGFQIRLEKDEQYNNNNLTINIYYEDKLTGQFDQVERFELDERDYQTKKEVV